MTKMFLGEKRIHFD